MKRRAVSCKRDQIQILESLRRALSSCTLDGIKKLLSDQKKEDSKFNVLRVLGIDELEIRHSFMLKWLLSPKADHRLGASFLKLFLEEYLKEVESKGARKFSGRYKALKAVADYNSFVVDREVKHIDLLLVSEKEKIVIAIENKWNASEWVDERTGRSQLDDYEEWVRLRYPPPKWKHYFIFLTLGKQKPSCNHIDTWDAFGYESVMRIVEHESIYAKLRQLGLKGQEMLLRHYNQIVKRKLMMKDQKLLARCTKIYDQNRQGLDFLLAHADRREPLLRALYDDVAVGNGEFLRAEKSESTSYVQYKRRLPMRASDSVHYEVNVGQEECKVLLHVEKRTDRKIKGELLKRISDTCERTGILRILLEKKKTRSRTAHKEYKVGGAEIFISRQGKTDDEVEVEIKRGLAKMYRAFEPVLVEFDGKCLTCKKNRKKCKGVRK